MRRTVAVVLVTVLVAGTLPMSAMGAAAPTAGTDAGSSGVTDAATQAPESETANDSASTTLTVLAYNDVQTAFVKPEKIGRFATLVEQRRAAHDNPTVLVGAGDQLGPHALASAGDLPGWRPPVTVMNHLDPTAEAVGNHDLDYGLSAFENGSEASEFPWVLANLRDENGDPLPGAKPYEVVEKDGVKVGVVGVTNRAMNSKLGVDLNERGYTIADPVETAAEQAKTLKTEENVDVVVVVGQLGVGTAKDVANASEHVDVVATGDDEVKFAPTRVSGTVVTEAQARAAYLAEVNLTVEDGEVTAWNGRLVENTENVSVDETVAGEVRPLRESVLNEVVGESEVALDATFASNYHEETGLGNAITDSFRAETGADVAVTNAGGIRSNSVYGPGELTRGDVYNILPFHNTLVTVELSGAELEQLLASQVVTLESEGGQQYGEEAALQVSGVSYEFVPHERVPYSERIQDVYVNGEPLDADATYTVTVNSYMAGWDGSVLTNATVVDRTSLTYAAAFENYVQENSPISPEGENRIRRVDYVAGDATAELDGEGSVSVTFPTPENASTVHEGSFYAMTSEYERVNASDVTVGDGEVTVTFDDAALAEVVGDSTEGTLEVYGTYNSSTKEPVYYDAFVLEGDLEYSVAVETTTSQSTTASTSESTTAVSQGESTTAETTDSTPGFGVAVGLVAVLAAALVARRRN